MAKAISQNELIQQENLERETQRQSLLLRLREKNNIQQEINSIRSKGNSYKRPSYFKYGILFSLAIIVDVLDIIGAITGVGVVVSSVISFVVALLIIPLILWFTDTKVKSAQNFSKELDEKIARITRSLKRLDKLARSSSKALRKVQKSKFATKGIKSGAKKLRGVIINIRKKGRVLVRNPIVKGVIAGGANTIPYLGAIPFVTFFLYLTYRDEKKTYMEAREMSEDVTNQMDQTVASIPQYE